MNRSEDGSVTYIYYDWSFRKTKKSILSANYYDRLRLLAISSCCSDYQSRESTEYQDDANVLGQMESRIIFKTQYRNSFYNDNEAEKVAVANCSLCSDKHRNRDVWGLLIYLSNLPDTYFRVGAFLSRAEHGGKEIFEHAETKTLKLV
jgi:hypothetical protein